MVSASAAAEEHCFPRIRGSQKVVQRRYSEKHREHCGAHIPPL